jgi:MFS family permease
MEEKLVNDNIEESNNLNTRYKSLIQKIGLDGKYQKILFLITCLFGFMITSLMVSFPLQKEFPSIICSANKESELEEELLIMLRNPKRYKMIKDSECVKFHCKGEKDNSVLFIADYHSRTNFVTVLDLICKRDRYFELLNNVIFLGRIVGNFIHSYITDKYGRLNSLYIQFYLIFLGHIILLLIKNEWIYLIISPIMTSTLNFFSLSTAMSTETMSLEYYTVLMALVGACFSVGGITVVLVSAFYENWNIILLIYIFVGCVVGYLIYFYALETSMYLIDQQRYSELNKNLLKIADINGTLTEEIKNELNELDKLFIQQNISVNKNTSNSLSEILKSIFGPYSIIFVSKENTFKLLKLIMIFIAIYFVYLGQILNIEKVRGNIYFNNIIIYIGELIAELSATYIISLTTRRNLLIQCFAICTIFCFFVHFLEILQILDFLKQIMIFIEAFGISIAFVVSFIYAAEILDPNIKSTVISLLITISNLFMMMSPYMIEHFSTPFILLALISALATLNAYILK